MNKRSLKGMWRAIGPGLITGASDDDPSGIATFIQAGARYGFGLLWSTLFTLPLLIAIQEACARIGLVTGKGLAAVIRQHYPRTALYAAVSLMVIANVINLGADIGAMAAAAQLVVKLNALILTVAFAVAILLLVIFTRYRTYARILKWLAISLLAYPLTVVIIHLPWLEVLKATFVPYFSGGFDFLFMIIAILGTTISPFLFFWESSQEAEERAQHKKGRKKAGVGPVAIAHLRADNISGMTVSQIAAWCMILVGAGTLHSAGLTQVESASQAAKALEPLVHTFPNAGLVAEIVFAAGIIGLGMMAVPLLAGSAAYALAETFGWKSGLDRKFTQAPAFYGVFIAATGIGVLLNLIGVNPIQALVYAAVINGVVAVPIIYFVARIARSEKIMGKYRSRTLSNIMVWITFAAMAAAVVGMAFSVGMG